jgi:hypothetical protein
VLKSLDQQLSLHSPSTEEEQFTFSIETSHGNQQLQHSQLDQQFKEVFFNDFEDPIADHLDSISSINVQILLSDESGLCHLFKLHSCILWFPILFRSRSRMLAVNQFLIWLHWKFDFT